MIYCTTTQQQILGYIVCLSKHYQRGLGNLITAKSKRIVNHGAAIDKREMNYAEVEDLDSCRSIRYLTSIGKSVTEAWGLGWINPKFKAEVIGLEDEYHRQG